MESKKESSNDENLELLQIPDLAVPLFTDSYLEDRIFNANQDLTIENTEKVIEAVWKVLRHAHDLGYLREFDLKDWEDLKPENLDFDEAYGESFAKVLKGILNVAESNQKILKKNINHRVKLKNEL